MMDICVLKETHDNYTKLIREISSENDDLMFLKKNARSKVERLYYESAILKNEMAINRACVERLKLTMRVTG